VTNNRTIHINHEKKPDSFTYHTIVAGDDFRYDRGFRQFVYAHSAARNSKLFQGYVGQWDIKSDIRHEKEEDSYHVTIVFKKK
jgi:hypothetical protein